jgi:hypothetical protein
LSNRSTNRNIEGAEDIQLQESRCQRRWHRDQAGKLGHAQGDAGDGYHQNADQYGAGDPACLQADDQEETEDRQQRRRLGQVTEGHLGSRIADHDTGLLQRNQRQEQADAGSNRRAQLQGDAVDDPFANPEHRQHEEQARREEHRTQRHLPGMTHAQHHGVGEKDVQTHARRQSDRVVGDQPHDRRADGRGQAGGDEHRALVHARLAEDARVDEEDVGHGQEGGQAGKQLGAHVAVVSLELEKSFQHVALR